MSGKYIIGIDPGTKTGFCAWDVKEGRVCRIFTNYIHRAQSAVLEYHQSGELLGVIFEDARLRTWFGDAARGSAKDTARRLGAGSVRRDCSMWEDFLRDYGIKFKAVSPKDKGAKLDAVAFKRLSGLGVRGNEHSRDAFAIVVGLTRWPAL